jgi:pimeloyl-ACP methyl ester carboxylesterase
MNRTTVLAFVLLGILASAPNARCPGPNPPSPTQQVIFMPGLVEPHTPGSGAPEELATAPVIETLLGADPDLNQVSYVRTSITPASSNPPRVIAIMIPGFLGGATTYDPLARDLVRRFNGNLEIWAVDRRPNQLEDRLGAEHAIAGATDPECLASPPAPECAIFEGVQFYYPDLDKDPFGDFPGPGDLDLDLDGVFDDQLPLVDGFGASRGPALMAQDDVRFMAWWGLDTYFRDWKLLVEAARATVGPDGLVLLGGHSQGTTWASTFAAYDFDPDPNVVVAGHSLVDGLILMEGGGVGAGSATKPTLAQYQSSVANFATPGGPDVFLSGFSGIPLQDLGTSGEVAAIAAYYQPTERAIIQRTPVFGDGLPSQVLSAPATNRAIAGMFLDDDFSSTGAFRVSMGFTDNGNNFYQKVAGFFSIPFYIARPAPGGALRQWKEYDDPTLPTCPPNVFDVSPGCALLDNGPPSDPGNTPRVNGMEREVTPMDNFLFTQFGKGNGFEWYFSSARPGLDFSYGRDSSTLVAEHLATVDPGDEGPLVITQNAGVDVPVICIGGSNGLTPEPKSFDTYLASIATPEADQEVYILEGYAHLDPLTAANNGAVPLLEDWINRVQQKKLLENF